MSRYRPTPTTNLATRSLCSTRTKCSDAHRSGATYWSWISPRQTDPRAIQLVDLVLQLDQSGWFMLTNGSYDPSATMPRGSWVLVGSSLEEG
jgi:hypothetical protein